MAAPPRSGGVICTSLASPAHPPRDLHHHGYCMLGLRPRLKARPSLLDLVRRKNIEEISQAPSRFTPLEADPRPLQTPLPQSPVVSPQSEVEIVISPPPYSLKEEPEATRSPQLKMGPVSCPNRGVEAAELTARCRKSTRRLTGRSMVCKLYCPWTARSSRLPC